MIHKNLFKSIRYSCFRQVHIKFLYNGKFDLTAKSLVKNSVVITRVLCILYCLTVDGGHRAVIFDRFRGVQDKVVGEGTHFLIPWVQKPIIYDIRSRPRNVPVATGSKGKSQYHQNGKKLSQKCPQIISYNSKYPINQKKIISRRRKKSSCISGLTRLILIP